jgi:asparagine synthase (glutamine-hydrolysing)
MRDLARTREWRQLLVNTSSYFAVRPLPWRGILRRVQRVFGKDPTEPVFPNWINNDLARQTDLKSRWRERLGLPVPLAHAVLPKGHASLSLPQWSNIFENADPGVTRTLVEARYPFFDLRIVSFLLSLPPFPCFFEKRILRDAMNGWIPESVRRRPKTPLSGDPLTAHVKAAPILSGVDISWSEDIERFVDCSAMPRINGESSVEHASAAIRPICLNFWLQSMRRVRYNLTAEARNG